MLHGKLGNPPKEIKINKLTNGKTEQSNQEKNKEFLIFQGSFAPNCLEWKNALNYSEIFFNSAECQPISDTLDDSGSLVIKFVGDKKPNDGGNNNKLSSAQIAGIIVGIVAAVAIIVIVVVIIIIKKKKKQQKSSA